MRRRVRRRRQPTIKTIGNVISAAHLEQVHSIFELLLPVLSPYLRLRMNRLPRSVSRLHPLISGGRRRQLLTPQCFSSTVQKAGDAPYVSGDSTHFGFESVGVDEKEGRVRSVFENVADSYDVMNDVMSVGIHRVWKDYLLDMSAVAAMAKAVRGSPTGGSELRILDVAGGTGDVAFRFIDAAGCPERSKSSGEDPIQVTVCDINPEMLRVGEQRARDRFGSSLLDESKALSFVEGNAQDLHFADNSFDLYTIAFGLRNVTDVDKGLSEAFRVLKPGGRFMCLEFSQVSNEYLRQFYDAYSFHVIPTMGEYIADDRASYKYLVESIRRFSNQEELVRRMDRAGFQLTKYTDMNGGVVAIHEGWKPLSS